MSQIILKPWEDGYSVDQLPTEPATRRPVGTGTQENAKKRIENFKGRMMQNLSADEQKMAYAQAKATKKALKEARKERERRIGAAGKVNKKAMSKSAADKMIEHNFDPMDLLLNVAAGTALYDDHPFLKKLVDYVEEIKDRHRNEDGYGILGLLDQLLVEGRGYLCDSYTPKEHRIKVALELLQYARPKLKQTEHIDGSQQKGSGKIVPLTQDEIELFQEWFKNDF